MPLKHFTLASWTVTTTWILPPSLRKFLNISTYSPKRAHSSFPLFKQKKKYKKLLKRKCNNLGCLNWWGPNNYLGSVNSITTMVVVFPLIRYCLSGKTAVKSPITSANNEKKKSIPTQSIKKTNLIWDWNTNSKITHQWDIHDQHYDWKSH